MLVKIQQRCTFVEIVSKIKVIKRSGENQFLLKIINCKEHIYV